MSGALRSGLTLLVLAALVAAAAAWGWSAFTAPLPEREEVPVCTDTEVTAGTKVSRDQVVVSVFNGSSRNGLAGATRDLLVERDFVPGDTGNAPATVDTLVLSNDPENPAVRLVARQFKAAKITPGDPLGVGVTVVLGESFEELKRNQVKSVEAKSDATYCRATGSVG